MASRLRHYVSEDGPLILDGGLATELEAQGFTLKVKPPDGSSPSGLQVISVKISPAFLTSPSHSIKDQK